MPVAFAIPFLSEKLLKNRNMVQIPNNRITYLTYVFFMVILAWLTFHNLAIHQFENDDHGYLELLASAQQDLSHLFDINRQVAIRPPVDLLAYLSYLAWNNNPAPYHILLVIMQLLASFLLAYTFYKLGANLETSLLGGLLFLMNVSHFRVVQWITCRSYVLTLIFGLGILICFQTYLRQNQQKHLVYASLFLILSIFVHPATFTFALFCTYLAWRQHRTVRPALSCSWPLLILAPACVIVASAISLQSDQVRGISISFQPIEMLTYLLWYTSRLLTNAHWILASFKETPDVWELGVGFFVCLGIVALSFRKYYPEADWGIWILLIMLPFIYFPHMLSVGPSRHIYFSSAGSSLILASMIYRTANFIGQRNPFWGRTIFVVLILGLVSSSVIALKRSEAIAFYTTGRSYISMGNLQEGFLHLQKAYQHDAQIVPVDGYLRLATSSFVFGQSQTEIFEDGLKIYPNHPQLTLLLGLSMYFDDTHISQGRKLVQGALERAKDKAQLREDAGLALQNLTGYYHQSGQYEKAVAFYKEALVYRPNYSIAWFNMGNALYNLDRLQEAIDAMLHARDLDSTNHKIWYLLAQAYQAQGDLMALQNALRNAIEFAPGNRDYLVSYLGLGALFQQRQQPDIARSIYYDVSQIAPYLVDVHINLGILEFSQARYQEAVASFQLATQHAPDDPEAYLGLAQALERTKKPQQAIQSYQRVLMLDPDNQTALDRLQALR